MVTAQFALAAIARSAVVSSRYFVVSAVPARLPVVSELCTVGQAD
jgi:hypothetical protein